MTESELKKLAADIVEEKVFGSWMLPESDQHLIHAIFLPLAFKDSNNKLPDNVWGVYEHLDKKKKINVREYPSFISCKFLTKEDCEKLNVFIQKYHEMKFNFLLSSHSTTNDHKTD